MLKHIVLSVYKYVGSPTFTSNFSHMHGGFPLVPRRLTLRNNPAIYKWGFVLFGWAD